MMGSQEKYFERAIFNPDAFSRKQFDLCLYSLVNYNFIPYLNLLNTNVISAIVCPSQRHNMLPCGENQKLTSKS